MADGPSPRQSADGLVERSKALCDIGRWKDAERHARRAIEADPSYGRARLQLAHLLMNLGRANEAAELAKGVLAQEPTSEWAIRILGHWHSAHGRYREAVAMAEEAVRLSEGDRIALLFLSHAKNDAGDLTGARVAAERIVAMYPDWPDGFVRFAETRHAPEEAVQAFREALRLDPQCDAALAGLAGLSGSLAQYREAVSLTWSALRSNVADKARQRAFARSAWVYLALSRIVVPLRGARQTLADSFGESCAMAFQSTGESVATRLLFAFRSEAYVLVVWGALAASMLGATLLPDAISTVLVPLLGIPVFFALLIPLFTFFGVIASARRLVDLRIIQWGGRGNSRSLCARASVSGFLLFCVAVLLLLAWPSWAGLWEWLLIAGVVLAVQDIERWRDQWRDSKRTVESGSIRQQGAACLSAWAQRQLTPVRLALFLAIAIVAEAAVCWAKQSLVLSDPPLTIWAALLAIACFGLDAGMRLLAARCKPDDLALGWRHAGRTWTELSWMVAVIAAIKGIGGRLLEGHPVEALWPILWLPLIACLGWQIWRMARAMVFVVSLAGHRLLTRLRGRIGVGNR